MLKLRNLEEKSRYEEEIDHILISMAYESPDTEKYKRMSEALERVMKHAPEKKEWRIDPNTIAQIGGNLLGIGMILGFERMGVITSKALGFVLKNKI